jgi:hypothetical protein
MNSAGDDLSDRIKANGWRQGSIVSPSDCAHLELNLPPSGTFGVVASQDCDVVASNKVEPQVEVVAATHTNEPDVEALNGKNPRILSIPISSMGGYLRLDLRCRAHINKTQLSEISPSSAGQLLDSDVRLMARWLGKRYTRDAFPDTFNRRLASAQKKLGKISKLLEAKIVDVILVSLDQGHTELPPDQSYQITIWFVFRQISPPDDKRRAQAEKFAGMFVSAVESCAGIEVREDLVKSRREVTLEDLEIMKRFDYDFRSPESESTSDNR